MTGKLVRRNRVFDASRMSGLSLCLLMLLSSCGGAASAIQRPHPVPTRASSSGKVVADVRTRDEIDQLHKLLGPTGWLWRAGLPNNRLIIDYGNPFSSAMGPLGQYDDSELIARLRSQAQAYQDLDPLHPVVEGLDYVTPV